MKCAGLEHGKVGDHRSESVLIFHPAEEVVVRRIGFVNQRRPFCLPVIDDQVDLVAQLRLLLALAAQPEQRKGLLLFFSAKFAQAGEDIFPEGLQVALHLGKTAVFFQDLIEKMSGRGDGDLLIELLEFLLESPLG